ncbi:hypothetical protein BJV78DRAFT_1232447 [Lactifluus subvellereus]|nr:hypothetical protein BJV78DRAFT_1232447 [Lactifluus subvellereus]
MLSAWASCPLVSLSFSVSHFQLVFLTFLSVLFVPAELVVLLLTSYSTIWVAHSCALSHVFKLSVCGIEGQAEKRLGALANPHASSPNPCDLFSSASNSRKIAPSISVTILPPSLPSCSLWTHH